MPDKSMSIREKQKASLDALLFLDEFCKEHGLRYYLAYGTLIGAVRHHGFIPWDDDVDIHIPRPDYERLAAEFRDPSGHFKLVNCFNDASYILPYAKIQNMHTARMIWGEKRDEQGIGIDLFPLDGLPDDLEEAERTFQKQNTKWLKVTNRLERFRMTKPVSTADKLKAAAGRLAFATGYLSGTTQQLSHSPYNADYDGSSKVAAVVGIHSGKFRPFDKAWFQECRLDFEGYQLRAPSGYDEILTMVYGDYMKLPDENKRVSTHTDQFIWCGEEETESPAET